MVEEEFLGWFGEVLDAEKIGEGAKSEARTASMKEGMDAELGVFLGAKIRREEIGK